MSTQFDRDVSDILTVIMSKAESRAKAAGRVLAATERSEIARLVRESLSGNTQALQALRVHIGTPAAPAKAASTVNETTDLGRALLETGRHRSPFFAETAPRTAAQIAEDAAIPGVTPGISDAIGRMPLVDGDAAYHELTRNWALGTSFGGQKLG
jgi:hypothetical protein